MQYEYCDNYYVAGSHVHTEIIHVVHTTEVCILLYENWMLLIRLAKYDFEVWIKFEIPDVVVTITSVHSNTLVVLFLSFVFVKKVVNCKKYY